MKILTFAGSLRKDSLNKRLCHFVCNTVETQKLVDKIEFCDLQSLQIPVYDGDIESSQGLPEGVKELVKLISEHEALIVSTPEYNGSIPGVLKNALDWVSRSKPNVLAGKHLLLLAASPGALGGIRSLWHTRVPFEVLGCHVYPEMVGVSKANDNISAEYEVTDAKIKANLERVLQDFTKFIQS